LAPPRETEARTGEAAPAPSERAGARVHKATQDDSPSDRRRYRGALYRQSGKFDDAVNNVTTIVEDGVGVIRPTGQHVVAPEGDYAAPAGHSGAATPDLVVGVASGVAMIVEAVRAGRRARAKRRREHDANG
jgi:hypothetical protein